MARLTNLQKREITNSKLQQLSEKYELVKEDIVGTQILRMYKKNSTYSYINLRNDLDYKFYLTTGTKLTIEKHYESNLESAKRSLRFEAEQKLKRQKILDNLKIGDIFSSSWGYGQTNVCFYQVVELKGKSTVVLRPIRSEIVRVDGSMSGAKIPCKEEFLRDEIYTKRINKAGNIDIKSYETAYLWDGEAKDYSSWY